MPAGELGKHFDPRLGCPTKEHYAMAGAIFLKEFFDLTIKETVQRYLTDAGKVPAKRIRTEIPMPVVPRQ
ncbi:MAG TPA: hypothetical protein EYP49_13840 [Anaerolineae bacterium]|nr:hypothetical protein [Anaerolineae bacterium]